MRPDFRRAMSGPRPAASASGAAAPLAIALFLGGAAAVTGIAGALTSRPDSAGASKTADDLEPVIVTVKSRARGPAYRLGGRSFDSAEALGEALRGLATPGVRAIVRIDDDAAFADAAEAARRLGRAGLAAVSFDPFRED